LTNKTAVITAKSCSVYGVLVSFDHVMHVSSRRPFSTTTAESADVTHQRRRRVDEWVRDVE